VPYRAARARFAALPLWDRAQRDKALVSAKDDVVTMNYILIENFLLLTFPFH
jgi:hypothetical protein